MIGKSDFINPVPSRQSYGYPPVLISSNGLKLFLSKNRSPQRAKMELLLLFVALFEAMPIQLGFADGWMLKSDERALIQATESGSQ